MPNPRYNKGARGERVVRAFLEERGWLVMRAYASKGAYDLLGMPPMEDGLTGAPRVYLIEVKNYLDEASL